MWVRVYCGARHQARPLAQARLEARLDAGHRVELLEPRHVPVGRLARLRIRVRFGSFKVRQKNYIFFFTISIHFVFNWDQG